MVGNKSPYSSEGGADMANQDLLEFYQNKFDEYFRRDDKYKEKVDKHLKELIADRYELEAEVTRKGEKISDLQKALVDLQLSCFEERERFLTVSDENELLKKNEELLHENIRKLLSYTKDRDLRDRIIYILQDPKVEIQYRHVEGKSAGTSATKPKSTGDLLKDEILQLQSKVNELSRISKSSSDVILEDCRLALQKSREKILEDEQEIRKLQIKLQESDTRIRSLQQNQPGFEQGAYNPPLQSYEKYSSQRTFQDKSTGLSREAEQSTRITLLSSPSSGDDDAPHKAYNEPSRPLLSDIADIKFSLASLNQFLSKKESLLKKIKSTGKFAIAANETAANTAIECVTEKNIIDLQDCIRKCTRLNYDIKNIWTSANKAIIEQNMPVRQRDILQFDAAIDDLAVSTAESEILALGLGRARFLEYLVNRNISLSDLDDSAKCVTDILSLDDKVKSATVTVKTATDVIERIDRNINLVEGYQTKTLPQKRSVEKQQQTSTRISSFATTTTAEPSRFQTVTLAKQVSSTGSGRTRNEPIGGGEITRWIDKTLSKIRQIETGEDAKDYALLQHFADQIRTLSDKLKALYEEFNERNVQDSFTEYSAVTLSKLETLARQSRDTVIAAEAQISAYRSNAQALSEKLKDTQELLRESINECLGLKRKLAQLEVSRGPEQPKVDDEARQIFLRTKSVNTDEPENSQSSFRSNVHTYCRTKIIKESDKAKSSDYTQQAFFRTVDLDGNETSVKRLASSSKSPKRPEGPFECMFCKQGSDDHKLCIEKIKDLQANIRKMNVQMKHLDKEAQNEKKTAQVYKDGAEKANTDLEIEKQNSKETIAGLEAKNTSLLDQLKILKNRLKNMERFRRLEIEGFQTDIRNLKGKIKELERQLTRAVHIFEQNQNEMELLKTIHETAKHSKSSVVAIKRLKAKIYEMETDIKRL